jgi:hypothetical protein
METIVAALNAEINRLTQARAMLMGESQRKPGSARTFIALPKRVTSAITPPKRMTSPEGRARIAAAQKLRWAKSRKAA